MKLANFTLSLALISSLTLLTSCHLTKHDVLLEKKDLNEAQVTSKAEELYNEGKEAQAKGKSSKAIKAYKEIQRKYPTTIYSAEALWNLAELQIKSEEDYKDGFDTLEMLINRFPQSKYSAKAIYKQREIIKSVVSGDFENSIFGLFKVNFPMDITLDMIEKSIKHAPKSNYAAETIYNLARYYDDQKGDYVNSMFYDKRILTEYPNSKEAPKAQYHISQSLLKQSLKGSHNPATLRAALNSYNAFLSLYPKHALVKQAKKDVKQVKTLIIERYELVADFYRAKNDIPAANVYYTIITKEASKGSDEYKRAQHFLKTPNEPLPTELVKTKPKKVSDKDASWIEAFLPTGEGYGVSF